MIQRKFTCQLTQLFPFHFSVIENTNEESLEQLNIEDPTAPKAFAKIDLVSEGSPADDAGLKVGDLGDHHVWNLMMLVYDRNHYFGLGPIPKPKLAGTFGRYRNPYCNHVSKGKSSYQ